MVRETTIDGAKVYQCEECGLHFTDESLAEKCEEWCSTHDSCDYPIAKQSIEAQRGYVISGS